MYAIGSSGQCYKTFYSVNLPPFHGKTTILCYIAILTWKLPQNGSQLLQYFKSRKDSVEPSNVQQNGINGTTVFIIIYEIDGATL